MLEKVKVALRIMSTAFDGEIENLIAACKADLRIAGINVELAESVTPPAGDPLLERAIILYCKGHYGWNEISEKYVEAYQHLKVSLALVGDSRALE